MDTLEGRRLFAYDLALVSLSTDTPGAQLGDTLTGTAVVTNIGDTQSPAGSVYYALTTRHTDDNQDGNGPGVVGKIGTSPLPALAPGQTVQVPLSLQVVRALAAGQYYFSGVATERMGPIEDPNGDIDFGLGDANDENNDTSIGTQLTITAPAAAVGKADNTFGQGGTSTTVVPQRLEVADTAFDSNSGFQYLAVTGFADGGPRVGVLRIGSDGTTDLNYGSNPGGVKGFPNAPTATARTITRLDDQSFLIVASRENRDLVLYRLSPEGNPVPEFGENGVVVIPQADFGGLVHFDVNIVLSAENHTALLVGTSGAINQRHITVFKLRGDGSFDTSFGVNGRTQLPSEAQEIGQAATLLSDGRIAIAGMARRGESRTAQAIVLDSHGTLDAKFGVNGRAELPAQGSFDAYTTVAEGLKGSLYFAGVSRSPSNGTSTALVVKLKPNGKPEKFGTNGVVQISTPNPLNAAATVLATDDGGALLSIRTAVGADAAAIGQVGVTLARLTSTGTLLTTYGTGGLLEVTPAPAIPAADIDSNFDAYATSSEGEVEDIGGGKVRLLATTTDDTSTTLTSTQLVADGVDLSATSTTAVTGSVLSGKSGTIKVTVSNLGTLIASGKSTFTVTLFSDLDDTTGLVTKTQSTTLKLSPGTSKTLTLKYSYPKLSAVGAYYVAADITTPTGQSDIDSTNNRAGAAGTIRVGPAFSDVTFSLVEPLPTLTPGANGTFKLTARNAGNTNAAGAGVARLLLASSPDGVDAAELALLPFKSTIKANGSGTFLLKGTIPSTASLPTGKFLIVEFSGTLVSLDIDNTDNSAKSSASVT